MTKPKIRQGVKTEPPLEFVVSLRFWIRPAGWAGNDAGMFRRSFSFLTRLIHLFEFVQYGDESVEIKEVRWRRPGDEWESWSMLNFRKRDEE